MNSHDSEDEFFDAVEHSSSTDQLAKDLGRRLALETVSQACTIQESILLFMPFLLFTIYLFFVDANVENKHYKYLWCFR